VVVASMYRLGKVFEERHLLDPTEDDGGTAGRD
jgi:hypothetical protein